MDTLTIEPMSPREYRRVAKRERDECARAIRLLRRLFGPEGARRVVRAWVAEVDAHMPHSEGLTQLILPERTE